MAARRPTRAQQKEETRAHLVAVARDAFIERGFEGTTIREIARRAGVATGTVFVHFPDKHALLAAVFLEGLGGALDEAWRTIPPRPLERQLLHLAGRLYAYYAARPALARVLVKESLFMEDEPGEALDAQRAEFLEKVVALMSTARDLGEWRVDVELSVAVRLFFGTYFTTLVEGLRGELGAPDEWTAALEAALTPWLFPQRATPGRGGT